jgi:hypothetical protein
MHPKGHFALDMARRGFRVFPLREDDPDLKPGQIKRPALAGDWKALATQDEATIAKWWTNKNYNIAVATLPDDGLVILDYDTKPGQSGAKALQAHDALDMPDSFRVSTASGGTHVYLKAPKGVAIPNSVSKLAKNVDVRGNERGGYVVAPGSTIHGKPYAITSEAPIEEIPDWLIAKAKANRKQTATKQGEILVTLDLPESLKAARSYLVDHAPEALEGAGGDNTTFQVAARVKDFGLSEDAAFELISEHWNEEKAIPPWDLDQLRVKVANAYRHGSLPVGVASPHAEFGDVSFLLTSTPKPKSDRLYLVGFNDFADQALTLMGEPLVDDLLDRFGFSVLYGRSNSGKTFIMLDLAFCIAAGLPWKGKHSTKQGLVVYIAAEGGKGLAKRVKALREHHSLDRDIPLAVMPCPINLMATGKESDTRRIIELVREAEARYGQKCELLVVDTLSRALAGGDENASTDMGAFVKHADFLRASLQTHLAVVHHAGKDIARGARGWSGIQAAIDTEIEVHEGHVTVTKQRDLDTLPQQSFKLDVVEVGVRPRDGKRVTSCVVRYVEAVEFDATISKVEDRVLQAVKDLIATQDDKSQPVELAEIYEKVCYDTALNKGLSKANVRVRLLQLVKKGELLNPERGQYLTRLVTTALTS